MVVQPQHSHLRYLLPMAASGINMKAAGAFLPKSSEAFWHEKLGKTVLRDQEVLSA